MDKEAHSAAIGPLLSFGGACGLALLTGEYFVAVLNAGKLTPLATVLVVPGHIVFGVAVAAAVLATIPLARWILRKGPRWRPAWRGQLVVVCLAVILVQGLVLINELILWRSPLLTPIGLAVDLLWATLIAVLAAILVWSRGTLPMRQFGFSLLLGVVVAAFLVASVARRIDPPAVIQPGTVLVQTAAVFFAVVVSFAVPIVVSRLTWTITPNSSHSVFVAAAIATAALATAWIVTMSTTPAYRFEERPVAPYAGLSAPSVILIVIDTLRADHLSCNGYPLQTTPNIDEFGRRAVLYERCYSPANWTTPGHASIFTGRFPISHGAHKARLDQGSRYPTCFPLGEEETTLAEILSEAGYVTAAVVANYGFVSEAYGLDQGFHYWFSSPPTRTRFTLVSIVTKVLPAVAPRFSTDTVFYRRASEICQIALDWIRQHRDRPFLLFVNLMDPHEPYAPPSPWDHAFDGKIEGFVPDTTELRLGRTSFTESEWKHIQSQYDGEIMYVDSELGKFLRALDREGILSPSIVIVTSDHGEFLGEKGLVDHQIGLYDPVIRVPLIIKPADSESLPPPGDRVVQTTDIAPTVLDLIGVEIPSKIQGASLLREEVRPVIAQHYVDEHIMDWFGGRFSSDQVAVVSEGIKFISASDNKEELYNIDGDKDEERNLVSLATETTDLYRELLQDWTSTVEVKAHREDAAPTLDAATRDQLEALGYVR